MEGCIEEADKMIVSGHDNMRARDTQDNHASAKGQACKRVDTEKAERDMLLLLVFSSCSWV